MNEIIQGNKDAEQASGVETHKELAQLHNENTQLRKEIASLFDAIKHGDEVHKCWLQKAIEKHFRVEK